MSRPDSFIQRFLLEELDIRGAVVRLDRVWQALLENRDYAPPLRDLLGAMSAVTTVICGNLKQPGRITVQLQGEGPVRLLVVDCADTLNLRGYAKTRDDLSAPLPPGGLGELVGDGQLLLSLDMPGLARPYQSYVPLEGDSVAEVFEHYLTQSEQQPALLRTASSGTVAACLFLQKLPDADLKDPDGWQRVHHLVATLRNEELLALPPEALLTRLFHEEQVRLFDPRDVTHDWPLDWEKVRRMLRSLGRDELDKIIAEHGEIHIHDDLSNHEYRLSAADVAELFAEEPPEQRTLH